jgi:undecaprenyl-diphosphatase
MRCRAVAREFLNSRDFQEPPQSTIAARIVQRAGEAGCTMNGLDHGILAFLNQWAHRSWAFDQLVFLIAGNYFLKTGLIMALLYWVWFQEDERSDDRRATVVFGLTASTAAVLFARVLSLTLPFRERPLRNPQLHFVLPYSVDPQAILGWTSFPSDNAALFFGVATCIVLVSRRLGILAYAHVLLVVAVSRVYLGFHYPTDILAGAVIGVGAVSLIHVPRLKDAVVRRPMGWLRDHPQAFQTVLCVLIFFIGTTFEPLYPVAHLAIASAKPAGAVFHQAIENWAEGVLAGALLAVAAWAVSYRVWKRIHAQPAGRLLRHRH